MNNNKLRIEDIKFNITAGCTNCWHEEFSVKGMKTFDELYDDTLNKFECNVEWFRIIAEVDGLEDYVFEWDNKHLTHDKDYHDDEEVDDEFKNWVLSFAKEC